VAPPVGRPSPVPLAGCISTKHLWDRHQRGRRPPRTPKKSRENDLRRAHVGSDNPATKRFRSVRLAQNGTTDSHRDPLGYAWPVRDTITPSHTEESVSDTELYSISRSGCSRETTRRPSRGARSIRNLGKFPNRPGCGTQASSPRGGRKNLKVCYEAGPRATPCTATDPSRRRLRGHCTVAHPQEVWRQGQNRSPRCRKLARSYQSGDLTPGLVPTTRATRHCGRSRPASAPRKHDESSAPASPDHASAPPRLA